MDGQEQWKDGWRKQNKLQKCNIECQGICNTHSEVTDKDGRLLSDMNM